KTASTSGRLQHSPGSVLTTQLHEVSTFTILMENRLPDNALRGFGVKMPRMETPDFDVVILGAGPAGGALALALARKARDPARIALLGPARAPAPPAGTGMAASAGVDPRCLALNHGSRAYLETLQAWPARAA